MTADAPDIDATDVERTVETQAAPSARIPRRMRDEAEAAALAAQETDPTS